MSPDGIDFFRKACRELGVNPIGLVVHGALWVHPKTFAELPVWFPERFRGQKSPSGKKFTNEYAQYALKQALGISTREERKEWSNWVCCHIWGYDDPKHQSRDSHAKDTRFFSSPANMVFVPAPLKSFTDYLPEVKRVLRDRAYQLYGWPGPNGGVVERPPKYPLKWPDKNIRPFTDKIRQSIERRKRKIDALKRVDRDIKNTMQYWERFVRDIERRPGGRKARPYARQDVRSARMSEVI